MRRFLAIEPIPPDATPEAFRDDLRRLDRAADALGVRVAETIYSLERRQAYSVFEADTTEQVLQAHREAGLPHPDVFAAERVYTELLGEPRRAR